MGSNPIARAAQIKGGGIVGKDAEMLFLEWLVFQQKGFTVSSENTKGGEWIWILSEGKVVGLLEVSGKGRQLCFWYIAEEAKEKATAEPIQKILEFTQYLREKKGLHVSSCSTSRVWERDIQQKRVQAAARPSSSFYWQTMSADFSIRLRIRINYTYVSLIRYYSEKVFCLTNNSVLVEQR